MMRKAIEEYWYLRDVRGMAEQEAAIICWKSYKGIYLVESDNYIKTQQHQTEHRGSVSVNI